MLYFQLARGIKIPEFMRPLHRARLHRLCDDQGWQRLISYQPAHSKTGSADKFEESCVQGASNDATRGAPIATVMDCPPFRPDSLA